MFFVAKMDAWRELIITRSRGDGYTENEAYFGLEIGAAQIWFSYFPFLLSFVLSSSLHPETQLRCKTITFVNHGASASAACCSMLQGPSGVGRGCLLLGMD